VSLLHAQGLGEEADDSDTVSDMLLLFSGTERESLTREEFVRLLRTELKR
jgi:hypothetical protein